MIHPRKEIVITLVSILFGAILGWLVTYLFNNLVNKDAWVGLIIVISTAISTVTTLVFAFSLQARSRNMYRRIIRLAHTTEKHAEELISQKATLIPREMAYDALRKNITGAKRQVILLSYLMFDWDNHNRTFSPTREQRTERTRLFRTLYKAIENENIEYIRIFQLPKDKLNNLNQVLDKDNLYKKEVELISKVSRKNPERARFYVTQQYTPLSIVLVDQQRLYINMDIYDPKTNEYQSPYMLFIQDAAESTFQGIVNMIIRITKFL